LVERVSALQTRTLLAAGGGERQPGEIFLIQFYFKIPFL
jgi:hypothetical protein